MNGFIKRKQTSPSVIKTIGDPKVKLVIRSKLYVTNQDHLEISSKLT